MFMYRLHIGEEAYLFEVRAFCHLLPFIKEIQTESRWYYNAAPQCRFQYIHVCTPHVLLLFCTPNAAK